MMTDFTPLAALAGGALIGFSAVGRLLFSGRIAGITGLLRRVLPGQDNARPFEAGAFIAGMLAAPLAIGLVTGSAVAQSVNGNVGLMAAAGLLSGFGSAVANGCTSGHGVCGLSRLSRRSIVATGVFMAVAMATVFVMRHGPGGV